MYVSRTDFIGVAYRGPGSFARERNDTNLQITSKPLSSGFDGTYISLRAL